MNIEELEIFGFSENEARIYLTLLTHGALNPYKIAEKTGLNRSYLYDVLNRMVEKAFLATLKIKGKSGFAAVEPIILAENLLIKAKEFEKLIPQLEELKQEIEDTSVELHKGKRIIATLCKDILATVQSKEEVLIIMPDEQEVLDLEPILIPQLFRQQKEKNITERVIIKKGTLRFETENTTYKELPEKIIGNTALFIYGNKVADIVFGNPNYMTLSISKKVADTKRKLFEHLWSSGSE